MNYRDPSTAVGLVGRTPEAIANEQRRFQLLVEKLPLDRVREQVVGFLQGECMARLNEALANPDAILEEYEAVLAKHHADERNEPLQSSQLDLPTREQFEGQLKRVLKVGLADGGVSSDEIEAECQHARRELWRHTLDLAALALQYAGAGERLAVSEKLVPLKGQMGALADEWKAERQESIEDLRANLTLSSDAISQLLQDVVAELIGAAQKAPVELTSGVVLTREQGRLLLCRRQTPSSSPSSE